MTAIRVRAPAKINWTLEVLGKRPDGYHEVRTLLQTIALSDWLTLTPADGIELTVIGDAASLAAEPFEANLAYRAAQLLQQRYGGAGVHIALEKHIPIAAGLGGGSSDAAATLRGLRALWHLDASDAELAPPAAELGSDVPFFLTGGCALASGRGEAIDRLPDPPAQSLLIAWPEQAGPPDKTSRMYAALRPEHFTDGSRAEGLADRLRRGEEVRAADLHNVFEHAQPLVALPGRPHVCGSGPAVFYLEDASATFEELRRQLGALGWHSVEAKTLARAEALAVEERA